MLKTRSRILAVLLTLVMLFGLMTTASFAAGSVTAATINGTTATIETVGGNNYIRATISTTSGGFTVSEYSLRHAEVVLTATAAPTSSISFVNSGGGTYTASDVDLFNKVYTVTVDGTSYRLAAGLKNGEITINPSDPLKFTTMSIAGVSMNYRCVNVQNPYIGEPGLDMWTGLAYSAYGTLPSGTNLSNVAATITLPSGTTASGSGLKSKSDNNYVLNLSGTDRVITLSNGGVTRAYYIFASVSGGTMTVTFDINTVNWTGASSLPTALQAKLVGVTKTSGGTLIGLSYPSGTTVYQVLADVASAGKANFALVVSGGGSSVYVSGIGGMNASGMSGWMYKVNEKAPSVGAGSYVIQNGDNIRWGWVQGYGQAF